MPPRALSSGSVCRGAEPQSWALPRIQCSWALHGQQPVGSTGMMAVLPWNYRLELPVALAPAPDPCRSPALIIPVLIAPFFPPGSPVLCDGIREWRGLDVPDPAGREVQGAPRCVSAGLWHLGAGVGCTCATGLQTEPRALQLLAGIRSGKIQQSSCLVLVPPPHLGVHCIVIECNR